MLPPMLALVSDPDIGCCFETSLPTGKDDNTTVIHYSIRPRSQASDPPANVKLTKMSALAYRALHFRPHNKYHGDNQGSGRRTILPTAESLPTTRITHDLTIGMHLEVFWNEAATTATVRVNDRTAESVQHFRRLSDLELIKWSVSSAGRWSSISGGRNLAFLAVSAAEVGPLQPALQSGVQNCWFAVERWGSRRRTHELLRASWLGGQFSNSTMDQR